MQTQSSTLAHEKAPAVGGEELAEGLMLVRASTLKMIRFQLALERRDRRVALQEVDDLLAIDRRLNDYLAEVPAGDEQILFRNALDAERAHVNREKLTLVAEVIRRPAPDVAIATADQADDGWLGPRNLPEQAREHRRSRWLLAAVPILASAIAAGGYLLGIPDAQAWLEAAMKVLS